MSSLNNDDHLEDEKILSLEMNFLPESFRKKCEVQLNETPENKKVKMQELKTMLQGNQLTNCYNFKDDLLVQYLRHSKYDAQKAFKRLHNYVVQRSKHGDLYKSISDFHCKHVAQFHYPLPNRTPDGCTVLLTKGGRWNPDEMEFNDCIGSFIMVFSQLMRDPMAQINGYKTITDTGGTSWRHLAYCSLHKLQFILHATMDCLPIRFKEIHFINETFVMKAAWFVIKRFMSEKIRSRVFFHSKTEELLDFFPQSVLPVEYGGDLKDVSMETWLRKANTEHKTNTIEGQQNYY